MDRCPRCKASAAEPCVDRAGRARLRPHAARARVSARRSYDPETEGLIGQLPDLAPDAVAGTVVTLRFGRQDLTAAAVREKAQALYGRSVATFEAGI